MASNVTRNPSYLNRQLTIDRNVTSTTSAQYKALTIDFDKTGASEGWNAILGLDIDMDNTTAIDGYNAMYGIVCSPTMTMAADAGTSNCYGIVTTVTGNNAGSTHASTNLGIGIRTLGADINNGLELTNDNTGKQFDIRIQSSADTGDYFNILTVADGATTIATVDDDGNDDADLTFDVDGSIVFDAVGDVGIGTSSPVSAFEIQDGLTTTGAILTLGTKEPSVVEFDVLGRIDFYAPLDTGVDSDVRAASIAAFARDTFSDSVNSTGLSFQTAKSGLSDSKMLIDEDGNVGIGVFDPDTTLEVFSTSAQLKLSYDADDYFRIAVAADGHTTMITSGSANGNINIEPKNDLNLKADTIKFYHGSDPVCYFNMDGTAGQLDVQNGAGDAVIVIDDGDRNLYFYDKGGEYIASDGTDFDIVSGNDLTITAIGDCIIDKDVSNTSAGTYTGLSIDFDKTGASTSDNTLYGLNIDMSANAATNGTNNMYGVNVSALNRHAADAGTQNVYGGKFLAISDTDGTTTTYGLHVMTGAADTNHGIVVNCEDGGRDLQLLSSANTSDYFQIATTTEGATTISTEDADTAVAHLTLDVDGSIILDPHDGKVRFYDAGDADDSFLIQVVGGTGATQLKTVSAAADGHLHLIPDGNTIIQLRDSEIGSLQIINDSNDNKTFDFYSEDGNGSKLTLYEMGGETEDDFFYIDCLENGETNIGTVDDNAAVAHLNLMPDGEIILSPAIEVRSTKPIKINEAASPAADTAAYGQLWVKDETPNELYFTTDEGDDIQLTDGTSAAGGGGGTSYWQVIVPGYRMNNTSTTYYYTFYRNWYENWSNSDSSPTSISWTDSYSAFFIAPRAGTITNLKIQGTAGDVGYDDPFRYYIFKSALSSNSSTMTLTAMVDSGAITPPGQNKTWSHTVDFSSSNDFAEDDNLYIFLKKDSNSGNQDLYFNICVNGEYS